MRKEDQEMFREFASIRPGGQLPIELVGKMRAWKRRGKIRHRIGSTLITLSAILFAIYTRSWAPLYYDSVLWSVAALTLSLFALAVFALIAFIKGFRLATALFWLFGLLLFPCAVEATRAFVEITK